MALEKQFLAYGGGGYSASLKLMLLLYFSFCFYYHHAKDYPVRIPIIQEISPLYMIYIYTKKNKTSILKVLSYKILYKS